MVGTNVRGKCSECGGWFWEIEKDGNGRFIPDRDEHGQLIYSQYNNKPTYTQHRHVHECRGASSATKANAFERKLEDSRQKINTTQETIEEHSALNQKHIMFLSGDISILKTRTENIERTVLALGSVIDKIAMDMQTFLRHAARNGSFMTKANELVKEDNGSDIADEIANTDDKTPLDSHSINFVDDTEQQPPN